MTDVPLISPPRVLLGLLLRIRAKAFMNSFRQAIDQGPLRLTATVVLVAIVWFGLYGLFWLVFDQFKRTPLEATVAMPLVFNFFFVAILVMLTFSNAIIAYGALYTRKEAPYLLTLPATTLDVVSLKYLESLGLASWSLILLGIPLMLAIADQTEDTVFYFLFIAFFLAFIPIPGGLGLLLAWLAARYFPRRWTKGATWIGGVTVAVFVVWGLRGLQLGESATETWLRSFLERMSFVESAFLPNYWVATGIDHALQQKFGVAALYLGVTIANALFLSWLAVTVVSAGHARAYDRACSFNDGVYRVPSSSAGGLVGGLFFWLPHALRLMAAKDLRSFLRDPTQWSQLVILFGLLALYLTNMPTLRLHFGGTGWFLIIPFLNLCAVSLILATFTCRFVYPLPSMEGHTLWLISLLPTPLSRLLIAKFVFAMIVTSGVGLSAMLLASWMLDLEPLWAVTHLVVTAAICFVLCALAIGLGARFPIFKEPNAARIANGIGGTVNLLISVAVLAALLSIVGVATWHSRNAPSTYGPSYSALLLCGCAAILAILIGLAALRIGARHFDHIQP